MKTKNYANEKLEAIRLKTLVVGIDIAKHIHWARFVDSRGIEQSKAVKFENNKNGFQSIIARIVQICNDENFEEVMVGMEPTGHYWKALANHLMKQAKTTVVLVNPYHTKKAKELDDNSQTKSDKKDALTIARLVKDGRYFETYLPHDIYAELRGLTAARVSLNKRKMSLENTITAVMDEYFPEFTTVFKYPYRGKASMHILKVCPIPKSILELGEEGVLAESKKAVRRSVSKKKARMLVEAAEASIGVDYGEGAARLRIRQMVEDLEQINMQLEALGGEMQRALGKTGISEYVLSVKGVGVVTLAMLLGETGDPLRFEDARQISKLAGYNLVEDSSGKSQSGTCISKRGRKNLRRVLYLMSIGMVAQNDEMKKLYKYLTSRESNPLKKMQALVVIAKKILTIVFTLSKKKEYYQPENVFGAVRNGQLLKAAA
jgi:transposase